ncbi:MAG: DUF4142 domain-containing protein [Myxococcales bacterium]|nr:DUF4142 domain-containing protein [Myxococcales bacterium]
MNFAREMIRDHQQANQRLQSIARSAGMMVPSQMLETEREKMSQLRDADEDEIDEVYGRLQIAAHVATINLFERCAQICENDELKSFARDTLPTLREHHQDVQRIANR